MRMTTKLMLCSTLFTVPGSSFAQQHIVRGNDGERIASVPKSETQLDSPTMKIKLRGGQTNTLYFQPNGRMEVLIDRTDTTVAGTYSIQGSKLCLVLPVRGSDCWPYDPAAIQGSRTAITSDRGQRITVTYLRPASLLTDLNMNNEVTGEDAVSPAR